jgi:hypothetical protein
VKRSNPFEIQQGRRLTTGSNDAIVPNAKIQSVGRGGIREEMFFIAIDLDSGYWQVVVEKEAREKLAFFTPGGKKRRKVMPMGMLNSTPVFVAMMLELQGKWNRLTEQCAIKDCGSSVIVDDVLVFGRTKDEYLRYFKCILEVLMHYQATINLRKCKWFQDKCEFVGVDVCSGGNRPAPSKFAAFEKLGPPQTWSGIRMLIGVFGFYSKHIPLFELELGPWREILVKQPELG